MKLKIKSKLSLGFTFLFGVILLIGGFGAFYVNRIGIESKEILKDNYESIQFSKVMLEAADGLESRNPPSISEFEQNLRLQEKNITEVGEKELTQQLRADFEYLRKESSASTLSDLRRTLYRIMDLNMNAIVRKNNQAQNTIRHVLLYLGLLGGSCFLIVFTFILNFPGYIANPIRELTESIKQIANKNYSERLHFESNDEFGELAEAFNTMARRLDDYENSSLAKLIFEKKRIETIINSMKDPIIGLDEKRILLFVNEQAVKVLGLPEKELVGKYAPDLALHNDLMRTILKPVESAHAINIYFEGKESFFMPEALPVLGKDEKEGNPIKLGEVIILKNITRFQELDLAKTNFIATVSHELKTPIASIKLSSKLLEDPRVGSLNKEQQELVNSLKGETERLLKITGELLDLSQVETGKIHLCFQASRPEEILRYAMESLQVQAKQKNISVEVKNNDEALPLVHADLEKTVWVLVNLLSNAIRYSPENARVILELRKRDKYLEFSVQDFGKGIEAKYQDKIFDRFFRIPGGEVTGTGLGLAIAREFIKAQGGEIGLDSEFGKGSRFYFRLPYEVQN